MYKILRITAFKNGERKNIAIEPDIVDNLEVFRTLVKHHFEADRVTFIYEQQDENNNQTNQAKEQSQ